MKTNYRVIITYFDTGTKREHDVEFTVAAGSDEEALRLAKREFHRYEKGQMASWVRMIRQYRIFPLATLPDEPGEGA